MTKDRKKFRAKFRKGHATRARDADLTKQVLSGDEAVDDVAQNERVTGKGALTRHRTIVGHFDADEASGVSAQRDVDQDQCLRGRVLRVHGLSSVVRVDDGRDLRCAVRGVLKSMATDQRHVVAAGDIVWIRPEPNGEGFIERIDPRAGSISRTSRGKRHVIVANVDQLLIVASAAEPRIKPNLIDRYLVTAEQSRIEPIVCVNKVDLTDPAELQPLLGVYSRMGYEVLLVSATEGWGIDRLRDLLRDRQTAVAGQSGVGKSSLLNGVEPELGLKVAAVSEENEKGRHTTTTARLIPLSMGGYVVDTPGIRQFQLWDVIPEETAGLMRDVRPWVAKCRFPDCTHTHEQSCAVKDAVADGRVDLRRYESYCQMFAGETAG